MFSLLIQCCIWSFSCLSMSIAHFFMKSKDQVLSIGLVPSEEIIGYVVAHPGINVIRIHTYPFMRQHTLSCALSQALSMPDRQSHGSFSNDSIFLSPSPKPLWHWPRTTNSSLHTFEALKASFLFLKWPHFQGKDTSTNIGCGTTL